MPALYQLQLVPGITDLGLMPRKVSNVAIVGGGLMGSGIATALIQSHYPVILKEVWRHINTQARTLASPRAGDSRANRSAPPGHKHLRPLVAAGGWRRPSPSRSQGQRRRGRLAPGEGAIWALAHGGLPRRSGTFGNEAASRQHPSALRWLPAGHGAPRRRPASLADPDLASAGL